MATNTWMEPVFIRWSEKRGDGTKAPSKRTIVRGVHEAMGMYGLTTGDIGIRTGQPMLSGACRV